MLNQHSQTNSQKARRCLYLLDPFLLVFLWGMFSLQHTRDTLTSTTPFKHLQALQGKGQQANVGGAEQDEEWGKMKNKFWIRLRRYMHYCEYLIIIDNNYKKQFTAQGAVHKEWTPSQGKVGKGHRKFCFEWTSRGIMPENRTQSWHHTTMSPLAPNEKNNTPKKKPRGSTTRQNWRESRTKEWRTKNMDRKSREGMWGKVATLETWCTCWGAARLRKRYQEFVI